MLSPIARFALTDYGHRGASVYGRGNKPDVQAEFGYNDPPFVHRERLAFPIRPHLGEIDYPTVFTQSHPAVLGALETHPTATDLIPHLSTTL